MSTSVTWAYAYNNKEYFYFPLAELVDRSCIPTNSDAKQRSGGTKMQAVYENVHPNLFLVLLFIYAPKWKLCGKDHFVVPLKLTVADTHILLMIVSNICCS